jgi:hypothetical protein
VQPLLTLSPPKTGVGETLAGTLTHESSEPPRYTSYRLEITNFEIRIKAELSKLHKRHTVSLTYVSGGRQQIVLSADLHGRGSGSFET